jgi:hypothetical protein
VIVLILPERRWHRLIEVGQRMVGEIDDLISSARPGRSSCKHPIGDRPGMAARPRAASDDRNSHISHDDSPVFGL